MVITTDRLILRPFVTADLDELAVIRAKPEVMKYIADGQPQTRAQVAKRLNQYITHYEAHGFSMFALINKTDGRLIGPGGLFTLRGTTEVEVGYCLDKPFWGQGLATEMTATWLRYGFEELMLKTIAAVAYPENAASRRVMEKVGLTYRQNGIFHGVNSVYYRIERAQFRPLPFVYQVEI
jgi:ribosomal-protein-alanine N-acetyltransferase